MRWHILHDNILFGDFWKNQAGRTPVKFVIVLEVLCHQGPVELCMGVTSRPDQVNVNSQTHRFFSHFCVLSIALLCNYRLSQRKTEIEKSTSGVLNARRNFKDFYIVDSRSLNIVEYGNSVFCRVNPSASMQSHVEQ